MKVYPWKDVTEALLKRRLDGFGYCLQFNCRNCKRKQTIDIPNVLFECGKCEECGHVTSLVEDGCNYMLFASRPGSLPVEDILAAIRTKKRR